MRARVGIVSWNTAELLDHCLAALPEALDGVDAEIVVVDNASSDDSDVVVRTHPGVRLIQNERNIGYARAMNQALAGAGDVDALIALNPDTIPPPGCLRRLCEVLVADPELGLVVPRLEHPDGSGQHSVYRFPSVPIALAVAFLPAAVLRRGLGPRLWLEGHSPHDETQDIDWAIGAVHVIRPAALEGDPPYSTRWFMYVEDLELCGRLAERGWRRRLVADVSVAHVGNAAGAQAWGEERMLQWLSATYDWYEMANGRWRTRAWALANVAGVLFATVKFLALAVVSRSRRADHRHWARQMLTALPLHVLALVGGASSLVRRAAETRHRTGMGD